jgi:hypothetical protein
MAKAVGVVDVEHAVDAVDTVDTVDTEEAVEPETATKVSARIAILTAILQMHDESGNVLRREETTMRTFISSVGSQDTSKWIVSPTNVLRSGGKSRKLLLQQPSLRPGTAIPSD